MKNNEYIVFQRFSEEDSLRELIAALKNNQIDYLLEDTSLNMPLSNNALTKSFVVKLKKEDFAIVEDIQKKAALSAIDKLDRNYPLFDFSVEELKEVIEKPDEWSALDALLAQKLLQEKGIKMNQEEIKSLKQERIQELSIPDEHPTFWIFAGYIFAITGGLLGVLIGWGLWKNKKVLPDGNTVYSYTESDRKHGERMTKLGLFFLVFWILIRVFVLN